MFRQYNQSSWRNFRIFLASVVVALTFFLALSYERISTRDYLTNLRSDLSREVGIIRARIEGAINANANTSRAFAAILAAHPEMENDHLSQIASFLLNGSSRLREIAAAPDLVIRFVYPLRGNEAALGLDFRKTPSQYSAVKKALSVGGTVIAGPLTLVQGGKAFVIRVPVPSQQPGKKWWGIISGVLDFDTFLETSGLDVASRKFDIALRGTDGTGAQGTPFLGRPAIFANDPILADITFPNGAWQLAVAPAGGWPTHAPDYLWARGYFAAGGLLMLAIILGATWLVQKRQQAEAVLASAIEAIDAGFALFDADDRLIAFNSNYYDVYKAAGCKVTLGTPFIELLRNGLERKIFPDAIGREQEWLSARMRAHRQERSSIEQHLASGRWISIRERRTPDGGSVGIRMDITALKQAREAAEAANRAKSEFLNTMTHELRTPLTVILGFTPILSNLGTMPSVRALQDLLDRPDADIDAIRKAVARVVAEISGFATTMDRSGKHLLSLVNDILDLSKAEAGRIEIAPTALDLDRLLATVVEQFTPEAERKGIGLGHQPSGLSVQADEVRLRQILVNLVGNALKFTDSGEIEITAHDMGEQVEIRVRDTGCGIPEDAIDNIFATFTQIDTSDTRRAQGTGLGLAITKKLVTLHGGTIRVESTPGKGSTFAFTMPKPPDRNAAT